MSESNRRVLEKRALFLGASDSKFISSKNLSIEDRLVQYCRKPRCPSYGMSIHCPPYVMTPEKARQMILKFPYALLFKIDVPPSALFKETGLDEFRKIFEMAADLERCALELGYEAFALAAGSCKGVFCRDRPCEALIHGGRCGFPLLARPSMEAIGINVFQIVQSVGWGIHKITKDTHPEEVPSAMLTGLVLIGSH